jgi:glucokinase
MKKNRQAFQNDQFIGIEIGGTKLQIVNGYANGNVISTHRFDVNKEEGAIGIRNNIEKTLHEYNAANIAAIGVGFGGPVDRFTGRIETSFHIEGWSGFAISAWLESVASVPVFIDNDANVAALGEATHGAGKEHEVVLYITLGSGVGGGLVIHQKIYHGAIPGELEIGHIQMDRAGTTLQSRCSGWAVDEKIRAAISNNPKGVLATLASGKIGAEAVFLMDALKANDKIAWEIFEETTDDFAFGLSHAIHLLHPDVVVLGGGLSFLGELLETTVKTKLSKYLMKAFAPGPLIKLAQLAEKAVPIGCLVLCGQNTKNSTN